MAEAKEPGATYQRNYNNEISIDYKIANANKIIDMGRKNKILAVLNKEPQIFTHLHTLCNGGNAQEFKPLLDRMILAGDVEKHVNGRTIYSLTDQGRAKVKQIKKASKKLFS